MKILFSVGIAVTQQNLLKTHVSAKLAIIEFVLATDMGGCAINTLKITDMKIIVTGARSVPTSLIKEAEERGVEIIQTEEKEYERTEFMDKIYTMHELLKLKIPFFNFHIPHYGHGKGGRTQKQITKDRKKNKNKKTHRR